MSGYITYVAAIAMAQQGPVYAPPPPPLPNEGEIHCGLKSEDGKTVALDGTLGRSKPFANGQREAQAKFTSADLPDMAGTYSVEWGSSSGRFLRSTPDLIVSISLLTPTYMASKGAAAAEVWRTSGATRDRRYLAGFCTQSLRHVLESTLP